MTVKLLSKQAFEASRGFIEAKARDLEVARFHYRFDGGSAESVLTALEKYQNDDGGFGNALEPDLRAKESSPLATSVAFQILRSIQTPSDRQVVTRAIAYLLNTLDKALGCWRIIPPSAEESPHAPWWNQEGIAERFNHFSLNPTAEILGYLYDFQDLVPAPIITLVLNHVTNYLSSIDNIEMHDLLCCLRLLRTETLPENVRDQVRQKLTELIQETIVCDPEQWAGYCLRPLQVVESPSSPFMKGLEDALAINLDYEISSQNEAGSWTPTWTWGDSFPDVWRQTYQEWAGVITLDKLCMLQRFNRIKGNA